MNQNLLRLANVMNLKIFLALSALCLFSCETQARYLQAVPPSYKVDVQNFNNSALSDLLDYHENDYLKPFLLKVRERENEIEIAKLIPCTQAIIKLYLLQ